MKIDYYLSVDENEKPLDSIITDGGFCSIFRTIGCIGDSLSSGEFESLDVNGNKGYHDYFEYSWGQFIARNTGSTVYNFSRGGMTASEYWNGFAQENGFWSENKLCRAYIIALGVNDLIGQKQPLGAVNEPEKETFASYYTRIIMRLKSMQPRAKFFLVTMPRENDGNNGVKAAHAQLLNEMAEKFSNTYVLDLFRYAPVYDEAFKSRYYLGGHMNAAGYALTARIIESYIDYIIRHSPADFEQVGFIGTTLGHPEVI